MMTEEYRSLSERLVRLLELNVPPVQISYLDSPPPGVPEHTGGVPSVCSFFALGTQRPFFAPLAQHENCEIGAFVMGVPPEGELGRRLTATVGRMRSEGYLAPGEEAKIPRNPVAPKFVAYGPLGTLPMPPQDVLLFANPRSAMLALEAAGSGPDARPVPMNGRPMCAIVPNLRQGSPVALSLGCVGSRIYADLGPDQLVVGIRGDHLAPFVEKVERIVRANAVIGGLDAERKAAAQKPPRPTGPQRPSGPGPR